MTFISGSNKTLRETQKCYMHMTYNNPWTLQLIDWIALVADSVKILVYRNMHIKDFNKLEL